MKCVTRSHVHVELGHHDGKCSFGAIIERYGQKEEGLLRLAQIVHGADTDDVPVKAR